MPDDKHCELPGCTDPAACQIEVSDGRRFLTCENHAEGKPVVGEVDDE